MPGFPAKKPTPSLGGGAAVIVVFTALDGVVTPAKARFAVLVIVVLVVPLGNAAAVPVIVSVSVPVLAATVPRWSVTVLPLIVTVPAASVAWTLVKPAGTLSVTIAPVAAVPPELLTVTV